MRLVHGLVSVACVAALCACNRNNNLDRDGTVEQTYGDKSGAPALSPSPGERVGVTTVTGADLAGRGNDLAIERIASARCARETACNNVGSDKHFVSPGVCMRELRTRMGDDLRASECPRGIDSEALDKCLETIRSESCNNPIETIQRLAACRTSDLCLKVTERTR